MKESQPVLVRQKPNENGAASAVLSSEFEDIHLMWGVVILPAGEMVEEIPDIL